MDDFEALASATYRKVGIDADGEDLVLFHLVHAAMFGLLKDLERIDPARFPAEPVDPRCAPEAP